LESTFIKVPPRISRPDIWAQYRPKETKSWIINLPTANYAKVAELISERLRQLNRLECGDLERFELLEIIRPTVYELLDYLRSKSVGTMFPLNKENKKLSEFLFSIATELASSYWSIAQALKASTVSHRLEKKSAIIAQRTLASIGQILFLHYLFKQAEPKGIWSDIHKLFLTFHNCSKNKVMDDVGRKLPKTSFADGYIQLLLLRLAEPYSLVHTEVIELFVSLEKWAGMVKLELLTNKAIPNLPYSYVDFQKDFPAVWLGEGEPLPTSFGSLNLLALLRLLSDHKEFIDLKVGRYDAVLLKGAQLPLSLGLVEHLEQCWSGVEKPVAKMFGNKQSRLFLLGLKAIHQNLTTNHGADEVIQSEWFAETRDENFLLCDFPEPERISLGQLIAFRKLDDAKNRLALGVISKILNKKDGSVEFQLELLAGKPQPAGIQSSILDNQSQTYQRTILFFTKESVGQKIWIIVDSKHIKQGDKIRLITSREAVIVGISRKVNIGFSNYLLECKALKKAS
jgi:hypothetical protein